MQRLPDGVPADKTANISVINKYICIDLPAVIAFYRFTRIVFIDSIEYNPVFPAKFNGFLKRCILSVRNNPK